MPSHSIAIDFWRAMALRGFEGALGSAGLGLEDAALVDVPADAHKGQWAAELDALRRGDVDAVYVKGAVAVEAARRAGAEVAVELDELPGHRFRINNGTPAPSPSTSGCWTTTPTSSTGSSPSCSGRPTGPPDTPPTSTASWAPRRERAPTESPAAYRPGTHLTLHPDLSAERLALLAEQEAGLRAHGFLPERVDVAAWADPAPLRRATARAGLHPRPSPTREPEGPLSA